MFELIKELLNLRKSISEKKKELELLNIEQLKRQQEKENELENFYNEEKCKYDANLSTVQELIHQRQVELSSLNTEISKKDSYIEEIANLKDKIENLEKGLVSRKKKLSNIKELYKAMENSIDKYFNNYAAENTYCINPSDMKLSEELAPTVLLKLHYMDSKELRKLYNENNKLVNEVLGKYEKRYTTKSNAAIYKLVVIALRAELQNILYNLKYERLEKGIEDVKNLTQKYLNIAADGNQSIAGTLVKFIGEIEYLFINAIKIEYEYYVKKQQEKEEQIALREQMKQEAEEKRLLEEQKKQIEREESKYKTEIEKLNEIILNNDDEEKIKELENKIKEIQANLDKVEEKKDEIVNLQNGKAGYVYVISNLGSFGENVFKIGMTRRLEPQDRINELGNASVPFPFDIHSFIFSEDAVLLEKNIHNILDNSRLNKVNLRKEFFKIDIDELEKIVYSIDSSAEFNKTILAEEYNQSLEMIKNNDLEDAI